MMRRQTLTRLLLVLVVSLLSLSACQGYEKELPDVSVDLTVLPDPPQVGEGLIAVVLRDANGEPISGAEMNLEGTMTHAGMKSLFADATEKAPGEYEATLEFTMGGDWVIIVRATLPDDRSLERYIDVRGVKAE